MIDALRAAVRSRAAAIPRGLRILLGIFGILMWVLGAQYLAGDAVRVAEWAGAGSEGTLVAVFLIVFGVALVAPFALLTDWKAGETVRNAAAILAIVAWFVVADAAADLASPLGVPYGAAVAVVFLAPFLALTALRLRGVRSGS